MRREMIDLIRRRKLAANTSARRQRAKLQLEPLETRTVFATGIGAGEVFTWIGDGGPDNQWSNPENWSVNPAGIDDDGIPDIDDAVIFDSSSSTDQSIMDLGFGGYGGYGGGSAAIKSLTLDWDGDLYIDGHLEVTTQVDWFSGKISGRQQNINTATTLYVASGAEMNIDGPGTKILDHDIVNDGIINWEGGNVQWEDEARILNSGDFYARAVGGKFEKTGSGVFFYESAFTNESFGGQFIREGGGTSQFIGIDFINRGLTRVLGGSTFEVVSSTEYSSDYRQEYGFDRFERPSQTQVFGTIVASNFGISDGQLVGTGVVRGPVSNFGGTVSPGASEIGTLTIQGNYTQGPQGALSIQTGASGASDKLVVTQEATLDGALNVQRLTIPAVGDQFEILQFARRNGDFATKNGLGPESNRVLAPLFGANNLRLLTEFTSVVVPTDVTSSVSLTFVGCTWNSRSRTWIQTVSIKNTSSATITGPFFLVFDGDPSRVANRTGVTSDGKAFIRVNVASLAAGASTPFITLSTAVPMRPSKVFAGAGVI